MSDEIQRDQSHPLYEFTQVITHDELHALVQEMYMVYRSTSWFKWQDKLKLAGGFSTLRILLAWLHNGKPYDVPFIQNQQEEGHAEHN